jgi:hypothetical protein
MRSKTLANFALSAAAAGAMALLGSSAASAAVAAPSVTASPATGLSDGQSISAAVAGYGAGEPVSVAECAGTPGGSLVCDLQTQASVTTDAAGAGSTAFIVHNAFTGTDINGNTTPVTCATVAGGCFIGTTNASQQNAAAPISFGS